jgi:hypothetical protein
MPDTKPTREEDLRRLLTDAIEVQLAALRAGISFWSEWIEQTSGFVQSATKTLSSIKSDEAPKDVLLELVDAGRASVRSLTDIPRHTARRFLEELDKLEKKNKLDDLAVKPKPKPGAGKVPLEPTAGAAAAAGQGKGTARRRAGRVKA